MAAVLKPLSALAAETTPIMTVSRIIVGRNDLDPEVGKRIFEVFSRRLSGFIEKLDALAKRFAQGGERDQLLQALDDENTNLALAIAQPWYVGYVGTPSELVLEDDAEFVTYLRAHAYELIIDVVPRPSYSTGALGWWADPPTGVTPPAMPNNVRDWNFRPANFASKITIADPAYVLLVSGKAKTLDEARAQLALQSAPAPLGSKSSGSEQ